MILPAFGIVSAIIPRSRASACSATPRWSTRRRRRDPVVHRLGPPRVHDRHAGHRAAVLHVRDDADRGAHRREGLQLDRHDVARLDDLRDADAVLGRLPVRVHDGRLHRADLRDGAGRHPAQDTYYVVAHFHRAGRGSLFAMFAATATGSQVDRGDVYDETRGWCFWASIIFFFNVTFFPMHLKPRRVPRCRPELYPLQFADFNMLASVGAFGIRPGAVFFIFFIVIPMHAQQRAKAPQRRGTAPGPGVGNCRRRRRFHTFEPLKLDLTRRHKGHWLGRGARYHAEQKQQNLKLA